MLRPVDRMRILAAALLLLGAAGRAAADPGWWKDSVFYEIFPRSFQDSNGDGIGDLKGIISRLDYLNSGKPDDPNSLGVDALWLTPIFKSPSYHGYDAVDYESIQPEFGNLDDFKDLIVQAHKRGIKIVLDIAINHTSDKNPWFAAKPGYYCWRGDDPHWPGRHHWHKKDGRYYYGYFGAEMPDLNWNEPGVMKEVKHLLRFWADLGVDGFRLDAVRYYVEGPHGEPDTPATHRVLREFVADVKTSAPDAVFIGEAWADSTTIASYVNEPGELDLAFDFPVSAGLMESLKSGSAVALSGALRNMQLSVPDQARLAPFVTNHDMVRAARQLESDSVKLKLAAAVLLTLPGTPFIYYGEEIGLPGSQAKLDHDKRTPMQWTSAANHGFTGEGHKPWDEFSSDDPTLSVAAQLGAKGTLLDDYQSLIRLRKGEVPLRRGDFQLLAAPNPGVLAYARRSEYSVDVAVVNFATTTSGAAAWSLAELRAGTATPAVLWGEAEPVIRDGYLALPELSPQSAAVIRLSGRP